MLRHIFLFLTLSTFITSTAFSVGGNDDLPTGTATADADDELSKAARGKQRAEEDDAPPAAPPSPIADELIDDDDALAEAMRESRSLARQREENPYTSTTTTTTGGAPATGDPAAAEDTSMALIVAPSLDDVPIPPKDLSTPLTMSQAIMFSEFDGTAVALALDKIITHIAYDEALNAINTKGDRFAEHFSRRITKITAQIFEKLLLSVVNGSKMKNIIERMTGKSMSLATDITDAIHSGTAPTAPQSYTEKAKQVLRAKWAADLFMKKFLGPQIIGPLVAQSFQKLKVGTTTYNTTIKALQERYAGDDVLKALDKQNTAKYHALFDQKKPLEEELRKVKEAAQTIIDRETEAKKQPERELGTLQTTVDTTLANFKATQGWGDTLALWKSNKKLAEQRLEQEVAQEGDKPADKEKQEIEGELASLQAMIDSTLREFRKTQGWGDTLSLWKSNKTVAERELAKKAAQEGDKPASEEQKDIESELKNLQATVENTLAAFKKKQTYTDTLKLGTTHKQLAEQKLEADDTDNDTKQKAKAYLDALTDQENKKTRLEGRLRELNEIINQQKARAYFAAVNELESRKPALDARLKELKRIIGQQKAQAYFAAAEEQEKKKPALDAKIAQHKAAINKETAKIATKAKELSKLKAAIDKLEAEMRAYYHFTQRQENLEEKRQAGQLVAVIDHQAQIAAINGLAPLNRLKYNGKTLVQLMAPCPGLDPSRLQRVGTAVVSYLPQAARAAALIGDKYVDMTGMKAAVQKMLHDARDAYLDVKEQSEETVELAKVHKDELIEAAEREAIRVTFATAMHAGMRGITGVAKTAMEAHKQGKSAAGIAAAAAQAGGKGAVSGAKEGVGAYCQIPLDPKTTRAIAPLMPGVLQLRSTAVEHYGNLIEQADELSRKTHRAFILPARFVAQSAALYTTLGLVKYIMTFMVEPEYMCSNMTILLFTLVLNAYSTYLAYMDTYTAESYLPSVVPVPTTAGAGPAAGNFPGVDEESDDEDEQEN